MRQTVVGVFDQAAAARQAAQQLRSAGFADSVFVTDDADDLDDTTVSTRRSTTEEGGAFAKVRNFFSELFGSDDDRELSPYAEAVNRGGAIVRVEVDEDDEVDAARSTLVAAGAVDIDERANEWRAAGWSDQTTTTTEDRAAAAGTTAATDTVRRTSPAGRAESEQVIPVVQEDLRVGKRVVQTGGVRIYAHTVEQPVQESVDLRTERAEVERRPVDRPATQADLQAGERTIEVRETAEKAVVAKEARVVEEVSVGKSVEQRREQINDTLRHTEVEVESLGDADASTAYRSHFDTTYASQGGRYEDYEPAYHYGNTMHADSRYTNASWDEVEPRLRQDWEARNPGGTWERMKAAVRHGWDRMTS